MEKERDPALHCQEQEELPEVARNLLVLFLIPDWVVLKVEYLWEECSRHIILMKSCSE